ncbi:unnamed protein product [Microthlaspi erraticum]|uniref:Uncharacterized protein n=1 Tax=Microthlaspi erraticum TaxID=1685480 RepID=A0A6D2IQF6_9BRAS|nr:unnamed protein product [Microthlaspi erraticum]
MFRARPNLVRPSEVSAKVQTVGRSRNHDPGNIARGRPRHATTAHDQSARAGKRLAAAQPVPRTTADASVRAGKTSRVRPRFHRPNLTVRPQPADHDPSDPDRSDSATPDCPADRPDDRPNAAVDPKPFLKPKLMFSSPA